MMVRSVNENDFDRRFPKGFGRSQTTKTAADDHYPRCLRDLLIRAIDRIEISIVHHPYLKLLRPEISENLVFLADRDGQVSGEQTPPYQASQTLIRRIRISVVMPNHGMRTTSNLTRRTAGMSLSTFGSRSKNRWRLRNMYAPPAK